MTDKATTGRNALCPCGSGRKYKRCCEGKTWSKGERERRNLVNPFSALLVFALVGALGVWGVKELAGMSAGASAGGESAERVTPEPWYYDEVNDRHWNPTSGHAHWHDGPPPPESER